ncbi:DEAD/DEAH box helicase family protein [Nocardiopsis sp. NRRL B-16309]|uniref:DEAD/DEAH box helicase family protein n=1 Tax=Nocardiopsis sp. NRRL B-16309 TaxID=1519494 RepID=UPI0006AF93F3|nr:DEAD/DEAH box helicase family protein [Nocardiopsis sp. NRRL B-16309]KOX13687.1 hypothetical protein ADL05_18555 [Nocardiopsis sp. NRRL B-16309]
MPSGQHDLAQSGAKTRVRNNLAALRLLRESQGRTIDATAAEQKVLARWSGWGAVPQVFDNDNPDFASERAELRELLSTAEYGAAARTTLNAHYTDAALVSAIWDGMRELGFTGGNVLEPGCGSGNFIGLAPTDTPVPTRMIGVELDPITAGIAARLYPEPHAQVLNESFGDTLIPLGELDAAVGNVPFGDYRVYDPVHNPDRHSIHNHFINKSLDAVRPGGVVAMITSRFTLDSESSDARDALASKADLLGAIRLPASAHQNAAGTRVVTDILILRRRGEHQAPSAHNHWSTALDLADKDENVTKEVWANEYFFAHRHHVLGRLGVRQGQFGPELDVTDSPADLAGAVREAFVDIAATARERGLEPTPAQDFAPITVPSAELGRLEGLLQIAEDGAITKMERGVAHPHTVWPAKDERELRQLIGLRETYTALLDAEASSAEDTDEMAQLRADLNRRYDTYAERFGPLNRFKYKTNGSKQFPHQGQFRQDPMCSVVYALERFDAETQTAEKSSVFTRRVLAPRRPAEFADSPADALALCLDSHGRVDLEEIARLLKAPSADAAREALGTLVFDDPEAPEDDRVVAAAEYLSGDVRRKLRTAQGLVATQPHLQANIEALEAVVPADLVPDQIDAKLGASWIDRSYVEQFARELLDDEHVVVENPGGGIWAVRGPENPEATQTWGTDDFNAYELLTLTLNQKRVVVTRTTGEGKDKRTVVDQVATETARGKVEELRMRFSEWVWGDPERAEHLQEVYNDTFNGIALRSYDDVHMTLPGLDKDFIPRPHQYAAVARILNEPSTLLAHPVGAGKTAEMVMGAMEMRRLGVAKKPVVVVPNHMLEQVSREWLQIYPQARLLVADGKKMKPQYRADFIAQCANGDWDAVVMTHAQFEKLPMSRAKQAEYMQRRIDELQGWIDGSDASHDRITVKRLQRMLATAQERLERHLDKSDPGLCFEQSGIDAVIVDEAHKFKNGQINSNIQEAAKEAAGRADDMLMKTDFVHEQGGRVVFATATPIANSVSEAWMIQRYLRPDLLAERGLLEFDVWASTFGEVRPIIERNVDGDIREKDRFASFDNLPELLRMFHTFADIKTAKDLNLPVPEIGYADPNDPDTFVQGPQTLIVPHTPEQWSAQLEIQARAKSITGSNPGEHLVVRNHARFNALHRNLAPQPPDLADLSPEDVQRAIGQIEEFNRLPPDERERRMKEYYLLLKTPIEERGETPGWFQDLSLGATKADFAAHNIAQTWEANKDTVYDESERPGALQMVFCDLGTPLDEQKRKNSSRTFSVYEDLRDKLIARGVPAEEIRFIQETSGDDRKKAELFAACRDGRVSVLIGSTEMMGVGTNVQKRAVALHHLDCPWRPVDIEQREGRIERQGNLHSRAQIFRYVTPDSFDTVLWDTNVRKALFIAQVMTGQLTTRSIEDISAEVSGFSLTQSMAANNPLEQRLAENHKTLSRLEKRYRGFVRSRAASQHTIKHAPARIRQVEAAISRLEAALDRRVSTRPGTFTMVVEGRGYESRKDAGQALRQVLLSERNQALALSNGGEMTRVGSAIVGGFGLDVSLQAKRNMEGRVVRSALIEFTDLPDEKGSATTSYLFLRSTQEIREFSPHGLVTQLTNKIDSLDDRLRIAQAQLPKEHKKLRTAQANLERAFPWEQELAEARELDASLRAELGMNEDKGEAEEDVEVAVGADSAVESAVSAAAPAPAASSSTPSSATPPASTPEPPAAGPAASAVRDPSGSASAATPESDAASEHEVLLQAAREQGFLMEGTVGPASAAPSTPPPPAAAQDRKVAAAPDWTPEELAVKDAIDELEQASALQRRPARDRVLLRLRQAKPHTDEMTLRHLVGSAHLADPGGPWDKADKLAEMGLFPRETAVEQSTEREDAAEVKAPSSAAGEGTFKKARISYERAPDGSVRVVATPVNEGPSPESSPAPGKGTAVDSAVVDMESDEVQALGHVVATGRAYPVRCRRGDGGRVQVRMSPQVLERLAKDLTDMVDEDSLDVSGPGVPAWPTFESETHSEASTVTGIRKLGSDSSMPLVPDDDGLVPLPLAFDALQDLQHQDLAPLPPIGGDHDQAEERFSSARQRLVSALSDPTDQGSVRRTMALREDAEQELESYRKSYRTGARAGSERLAQIENLRDAVDHLVGAGQLEFAERFLNRARIAAANTGETRVWEKEIWVFRSALITSSDLLPSRIKAGQGATVVRAAYGLARDRLAQTHPSFHDDPGERGLDYFRITRGSALVPWLRQTQQRIEAVEQAGLRYEATRLYQRAAEQRASSGERDYWAAQVMYGHAAPEYRSLLFQSLERMRGKEGTEEHARLYQSVANAMHRQVRESQRFEDGTDPGLQRLHGENAWQLFQVLEHMNPEAAQGLLSDVEEIRDAYNLQADKLWQTTVYAGEDPSSIVQASQREVELSVERLRLQGQLRTAVEAIDTLHQHLEDHGLARAPEFLGDVDSRPLVDLRKDVLTQAQQVSTTLAQEGRDAHAAGDQEAELDVLRQIWEAVPQVPADKVTEQISRLEARMSEPSSAPSSPAPAFQEAPQERGVEARGSGAETGPAPSLAASPPSIPSVEPMDVRPSAVDGDVDLLDRLSVAQHNARTGLAFDTSVLDPAGERGTATSDLGRARADVAAAVDQRLEAEDFVGAWRLLGAAQVIDPASVERHTQDRALLTQIARHAVAEGPTDTDSAQAALEQADRHLLTFTLFNPPVDNRRVDGTVKALLDQGLFRHAEQFLTLAGPVATPRFVQLQIDQRWVEALSGQHQDVALPALLGEDGLDARLIQQARTHLEPSRNAGMRYSERTINRVARAQFNDVIAQMTLVGAQGRATALALLTHANHLDINGCWDRAEQYSRLRYPGAAFADGLPSNIVRVEHSEEGTRLRGVPRAPKGSPLHTALTGAKFKYSTKKDYWYLPSPWKVWTRQRSVNQLLNDLDKLDVPYITEARWQAFASGTAASDDERRRNHYADATTRALATGQGVPAADGVLALDEYVRRERESQGVHNTHDAFGVRALRETVSKRAWSEADEAKRQYSRAKRDGADPAALLDLADEVARTHPDPERIQDLEAVREQLRAEVAAQVQAAPDGQALDPAQVQKGQPLTATPSNAADHLSADDAAVLRAYTSSPEASVERLHAQVKLSDAVHAAATCGDPATALRLLGGAEEAMTTLQERDLWRRHHRALTDAAGQIGQGLDAPVEGQEARARLAALYTLEWGRTDAPERGRGEPRALMEQVLRATEAASPQQALEMIWEARRFQKNEHGAGELWDGFSAELRERSAAHQVAQVEQMFIDTFAKRGIHIAPGSDLAGDYPLAYTSIERRHLLPTEEDSDLGPLSHEHHMRRLNIIWHIRMRGWASPDGVEKALAAAEADLTRGYTGDHAQFTLGDPRIPAWAGPITPQERLFAHAWARHTGEDLLPPTDAEVLGEAERDLQVAPHRALAWMDAHVEQVRDLPPALAGPERHATGPEFTELHEQVARAAAADLQGATDLYSAHMNGQGDPADTAHGLYRHGEEVFLPPVVRDTLALRQYWARHDAAYARAEALCGEGELRQAAQVIDDFRQGVVAPLLAGVAMSFEADRRGEATLGGLDQRIDLLVKDSVGRPVRNRIVEAFDRGDLPRAAWHLAEYERLADPERPLYYPLSVDMVQQIRAVDPVAPEQAQDIREAVEQLRPTVSTLVEQARAEGSFRESITAIADIHQDLATQGLDDVRPGHALPFQEQLAELEKEGRFLAVDLHEAISREVEAESPDTNTALAMFTRFARAVPESARSDEDLDQMRAGLVHTLEKSASRQGASADQAAVKVLPAEERPAPPQPQNEQDHEKNTPEAADARQDAPAAVETEPVTATHPEEEAQFLAEEAARQAHEEALMAEAAALGLDEPEEPQVGPWARVRVHLLMTGKDYPALLDTTTRDPHTVRLAEQTLAEIGHDLEAADALFESDRTAFARDPQYPPISQPDLVPVRVEKSEFPGQESVWLLRGAPKSLNNQTQLVADEEGLYAWRRSWDGITPDGPAHPGLEQALDPRGVDAEPYPEWGRPHLTDIINEPDPYPDEAPFQPEPQEDYSPGRDDLYDHLNSVDETSRWVHTLIARGRLHYAHDVISGLIADASQAGAVADSGVWHRHRRALQEATDRIGDELADQQEPPALRARLSAEYQLHWYRLHVPGSSGVEQDRHARPLRDALVELHAHDPVAALDLLREADTLSPNRAWREVHRHILDQAARGDTMLARALAARGHDYDALLGTERIGAGPYLYALRRSNESPLSPQVRAVRLDMAITMMTEGWHVPHPATRAGASAHAALTTASQDGRNLLGVRLSPDDVLWANEWLRASPVDVQPPAIGEILDMVHYLEQSTTLGPSGIPSRNASVSPHAIARLLERYEHACESLPPSAAREDRQPATDLRFQAAREHWQQRADEDLRERWSTYATCRDTGDHRGMSQALAMDGAELFLPTEERREIEARRYWAEHEIACEHALDLARAGQPNEGLDRLKEFTDRWPAEWGERFTPTWVGESATAPRTVQSVAREIAHAQRGTAQGAVQQTASTAPVDTAAPQVSKADWQAATDAFERAGRARQSHQYRTAIKELDRARELDPTREYLWKHARNVVRADQASENAGHMMRKGKFVASLASLKEAHRLDPSRAELWERRRVQVEQARGAHQPATASRLVRQTTSKPRPTKPEPPAATPARPARPAPGRSATQHTKEGPRR